MTVRKSADAAPAPLVNDGAAFVRSAPDAAAYKPASTGFARVRAGKKVQVSFAVPEPLLEAIERQAVAMGQSRAFVFNLAVIHYLKSQGLAPPGV